MRKETDMDINYHNFDLNEIVDDLMDGDSITDITTIPFYVLNKEARKNNETKNFNNHNKVGEMN